MITATAAQRNTMFSARLAKSKAEIIEHWTNVGLSTEETDTRTAEQGIVALYAQLSLPAPIIIWCDSPVALISAYLNVRERLRFEGKPAHWGTPVKEACFSRHYTSIDSTIDSAIGSKVTSQLLSEVELQITMPVAAAVRDLVGKMVVTSSILARDDRSGGSGWSNAYRSSLLSAGYALRRLDLPMPVSFCEDIYHNNLVPRSLVDYGQHHSHWLAGYDFLQKECGLHTETEAALAPWRIVTSAGWFLPLEKMCFIARRHAVLKRDEVGRLHCEDGPAVVYPDGWSIYAWRGMRVPEYVIERPEEITISRIDAQGNNELLRHLMIEKYGQVNYWLNSGAQEVHSDETGRLYRLLTEHSYAIFLVRVVNSTPEPDGTRKEYMIQVPPDIRTARDGIAWTFNLTGSQYQPQIQT